jgi:hypothetical protein
MALLNGMLSYGGAAQTYFEYNTDRLASDAHAYVKVANATFADGYNYVIAKVGTTVEITLNEGYELAKSPADYISVDENGKILLTVPENKTVDTTTAVYHEHAFVLKKGAEKHWYECLCGAIQGEEAHKGGVASCTQSKVCMVCGTSYGPIREHSYSELKTSQTHHWYECECGLQGEMIQHSGGKATCTSRAKCTICGSYYGTTAKHNYNILKTDENYHWYECECGDTGEKEEHSGGVATTTELAKCATCGTAYGEYAEENRTFVFNLILTRTTTSNRVVNAILPEGTATTITVQEGDVLILPTPTPEDKEEFKFSAWKYLNANGSWVTLDSRTEITSELFSDLDLGDDLTVYIDLVAFCSSNWTGFY